jgi:hypothetical protein
MRHGSRWELRNQDPLRSVIDLQSSLMLCLAWLKTSRGPTKSRASMPGCSVNNTLMMGMESVAAMVATELLLRYSEVLRKWFE